MTSETSARETPAACATSSIVTGRPGVLTGCVDRLIIAPLPLERSNVRALQTAVSPGGTTMSNAPERGFLDRVAAGPISWGVCEVPGWGLQLEPDRVLTEVRALG